MKNTDLFNVDSIFEATHYTGYNAPFRGVGGARGREDDEGWENEKNNNYWNKPLSNKPVLQGMYFYDNVTPADEQDALTIGMKKTKSGKWALAKYNTSGATFVHRKIQADKAFGQGRWWELKKESVDEAEPADKQVNMKRWLRDYERREDNNFHTENVFAIAKLVGTPEDISTMKSLVKQHNGFGLSEKQFEIRQEIYGRLWPLVKQKIADSQNQGGMNPDGTDMQQGVAEATAKYKVHCSQCGNEFTRDKNEGYSHCKDHSPKKKQGVAEGVASDDRPEHQLHTELVYNHGADKIKLQYERDGDTNKLITNIQKIAKLQHGMDIDVDTAEWIAGDLVYPDILEQGVAEDEGGSHAPGTGKWIAMYWDGVQGQPTGQREFATREEAVAALNKLPKNFAKAVRPVTGTDVQEGGIPDYAAMFEAKLDEFASCGGTGSIATSMSVGSPKAGSLFGGSYSQKNSPFKKAAAKKRTGKIIKR